MANKKTSKKAHKKSSKKLSKIQDQTIHSVSDLLEENPPLPASPSSTSPTSTLSYDETYDNEPDESAECYLGVYYKVLKWAQQYTKVAIWNKRTNNWVEYNVQTHPQASEYQKKDAIRRIITDVCAHPSTREKDSRYYLA